MCGIGLGVGLKADILELRSVYGFIVGVGVVV